jgi:hypothetical protein
MTNYTGGDAASTNRNSSLYLRIDHNYAARECGLDKEQDLWPHRTTRINIQAWLSWWFTTAIVQASRKLHQLLRWLKMTHDFASIGTTNRYHPGQAGPLKLTHVGPSYLSLCKCHQDKISQRLVWCMKSGSFVVLLLCKDYSSNRTQTPSFPAY